MLKYNIQNVVVNFMQDDKILQEIVGVVHISKKLKQLVVGG
jgi:hypothetical protein